MKRIGNIVLKKYEDYQGRYMKYGQYEILLLTADEKIIITTLYHSRLLIKIPKLTQKLAKFTP